MKKKPNILFVISDDHRHDAIHSLGNMEVQTPVLDSIAENGVTFTHTHVMGGLSGAVCMPSRASVHSGANVFKAGGEAEINPELSLMPETFKQNGYDTYAVGKWHNDIHSFNRAFSGGSKLFFGGMSDHYRVPVHEYQTDGKYDLENPEINDQHSSELFADAAIDYLENHKKEDPFFLYVAYTAPHDPKTAPKSYRDLYDKREIQIPPNFLARHPFDNGELDIRDELLASLPRTTKEIQSHIADYYAMITHLDTQTGRILDALEETGQLDNTIIVYTADHGISLGQHGLMGKQNMYDHSVRVPFILSGPDLPSGKRVEGLTYQMDIYPTLCSLVGIDSPDEVEGINQLSIIKEEKEVVRDYVYSVYRDIQRMVKDDRWKLIRYYHQEKRQVGIDYIQLFDLKNDPFETNNLAKDPANKEVMKRLANELSAWQQSVGDFLGDIPILIHED